METATQDVLFEISKLLDTECVVRWSWVSRAINSALKGERFMQWADAASRMAVYRVRTNPTKNFFLVGAAGAGKSFTLSRIYDKLDAEGIGVAVVSPTAISAVNFSDGTKSARTIHSYMGIRVEWHSVSDVNIRYISRKARKNLNKIRVILIDEISMVSAELLEIMDLIARTARGSYKPMGGLQVVVSGDFYQLAPVKGNYAFRSPVWESLGFTPIALPTSMRHQADLGYYAVLQRIRSGEPTPEDIRTLQARQIATIPESDIPLKLFTVNAHADQCNQSHFAAVPGQVTHRSGAIDSVKERLKNPLTGDTVFRPTQAMTVSEASKKAASMLHKYPQVLELKVGAQYVITYNCDVEVGAVNGASCVFEGVDGSDLRVRLSDGNTVSIPPQVMRVKVSDAGPGHLPLYFEREQYPLKLGYGLTIHSAQGMTLNSAIIDLDRTFANHMVYVAASRVRTLNGLYLRNFDPKFIMVSKEVKEFYEKLSTGQ